MKLLDHMIVQKLRELVREQLDAAEEAILGFLRHFHLILESRSRQEGL